MNPQADIGLIGLAVMGENIVLNMESKGFTVAQYNRTVEKVEAFQNGRGGGAGAEVRRRASRGKHAGSLVRLERCLAVPDRSTPPSSRLRSMTAASFSVLVVKNCAHSTASPASRMQNT